MVSTLKAIFLCIKKYHCYCSKRNQFCRISSLGIKFLWIGFCSLVVTSHLLNYMNNQHIPFFDIIISFQSYSFGFKIPFGTTLWNGDAICHPVWDQPCKWHAIIVLLSQSESIECWGDNCLKCQWLPLLKVADSSTKFGHKEADCFLVHLELCYLLTKKDTDVRVFFLLHKPLVGLGPLLFLS